MFKGLRVDGETDPEIGGLDFWIRLLHHYVDELDFSNLLFDEAIRNL